MNDRSDPISDIEESYLTLLEEKRFDRITVKEIAQACNISRTAFYRYFESADDLLDKIERRLLDALSLYRSKKSDGAGAGNVLDGKPYESIKNWFAVGVSLRNELRPVMSDNGDVYFRIRLQAQIRRELNVMMDDECVPNDKQRPYYVELIAASYAGILSYMCKVEKDEELISVSEMAHIANSVRESYFRCDAGAPAISKKQLYGEEGSIKKDNATPAQES